MKREKEYKEKHHKGCPLTLEQRKRFCQKDKCDHWIRCRKKIKGA